MLKNLEFIKALSIFSISNIINAAIPFLLLPVLTNWLSTADFGIVAMFQVLITILLPFIGFNSDGSIVRYYYEKDKINYSLFISNAIFLVIIGAILLIPIFIFFGDFIIKILFTTDSKYISTNWLWIAMLIVIGQNIFQIQQNLLQVQYKAIEYGIFRVLKTFLELSLSILLIKYLENGWIGRIQGQFFPTILFFLISLFLLYKKKWLVLKLDLPSIKMNLAYGLPLLPHVISGVILTFSDRIFISNMIGISETGNYAVGYQIGMIIHLGQNSFNQAWVPWFFEKLKQNTNEIKLKIVKFTYLYFLLMILSALILTMLAPLIFKIFIGENFSSGLNYVFWIALGFAINGMYKMVVNYIFYLKKTYFIATATIVTASINIVLNYFLIKHNGAIGAAQATAISFTIEFILIWILSSILYKMPWLFFIKTKKAVSI